MGPPVDLIASASTLAAPLLIGLAGSSGVLGAIVAFVKLSGDRVTAAVAQAQGANEILETTLREVTRDRDFWRRRFEECQAQHEQIVNALGLKERLTKGETP